jgi:cobalt-zinc-cadmium efflux system protein
MAVHDHSEHDHDDHDDHSGHGHAGHGGHGGHGGHHHDVGDGSFRTMATAAGGNLALAILQLVVGITASSVALLADSGHQLVDVVGLVIAAFALRMARKEKANWSTYGWGRLDPAGALITSTLMIGASGWVIFESIKRLRDPEPVQGRLVIAVAIIGLLINGGSMFGLIRKGGKSMSTKAAILHLGGDAIGSVGVLIAGLFARAEVYWVDPAIALLLAAAIIVGAIRLLRSAFLVLLDATPQGLDVEALQRALTMQPNVQEVHHLHVWESRPEERTLTAHVRVDGELSLHEGQHLADGLRTLVLEKFNISHATFEVECHECTHAEHA